jgi:hypothetical protein
MTTRLEGTLQPEILLDGEPCILTLTADGMKLVAKGLELNWKDLLGGEQALAVALNASLDQYQPPAPRTGTCVGRKDPPSASATCAQQRHARR